MGTTGSSLEVVFVSREAVQRFVVSSLLLACMMFVHVLHLGSLGLGLSRCVSAPLSGLRPRSFKARGEKVSKKTHRRTHTHTYIYI